MQQAYATDGASLAILANGSVVTWGNPKYGGKSFSVHNQLAWLPLQRAAFKVLEQSCSISRQAGNRGLRRGLPSVKYCPLFERFASASSTVLTSASHHIAIMLAQVHIAAPHLT